MSNSARAQERVLPEPQGHLAAVFERFGNGTIGHVLFHLGISGICTGLTPVVSRPKFCGTARTLKAVTASHGTFTADDFDIGPTIDNVQPGEVLVFDNGGHPVSMLGGNAVFAAKMRGAVGLLVDGGLRDIDEILGLDFQAYSRHVVMPSGVSRLKVTGTNVPVTVGGVDVHPGDIVVADVNGVVIIPASRAQEVADCCCRLDEKDRKALELLRGGSSFSEVLRVVRKPLSND